MVGETLEEVRASRAKSFVKLSDGVVCREYNKASSSTPAVFIHGISVPSFVWDKNIGVLNEAGISTLRYDLFGRGLSSRPKKEYSLNFYEKQLNELLLSENISNEIDIVGVSLGGLLATHFAAKNPKRVRKIVLIDPLHHFFTPSKITNIITAPILGEVVVKLLAKRILGKKVKGDFYHPEMFDEFRDKLAIQWKFDGVGYSILSTLRNISRRDIAESYNTLASQKRDGLLIWGKHDKTIPYSTSANLRELLDTFSFVSVSEAGHIPHYEKPDKVNNFLIGYLKSSQKNTFNI